MLYLTHICYSSNGRCTPHPPIPSEVYVSRALIMGWIVRFLPPYYTYSHTVIQYKYRYTIQTNRHIIQIDRHFTLYISELSLPILSPLSVIKYDNKSVVFVRVKIFPFFGSSDFA
jgi:hypothetical protein